MARVRRRGRGAAGAGCVGVVCVCARVWAPPRLSVRDFAECSDLALGKDKVCRVPDLGTRHSHILSSVVSGHLAKWPF